MRLLVVELRRLLARKVVLLTVLGAVAVAVVSLVGVANQARQLESARAGADTEYQRMVPNHALLRLCVTSGVESFESELFHVSTSWA